MLLLRRIDNTQKYLCGKNFFFMLSKSASQYDKDFTDMRDVACANCLLLAAVLRLNRKVLVPLCAIGS